MLQLSGWVVIAIIQIIFVWVGFTLYFLNRLRRVKKTNTLLKARLAQVQHVKDNSKVVETLTDKLPNNDAKLAKDKGLLDELRRLREQLATSELRIKNLEKFRGLYFQIKTSIESISEIQDLISSNIDATDLPEELLKKLREAFERLNKEKRVLEDHVRQAQEQLDLFLGTDAVSVRTSNESSKNTIQQQKAEIAQLSLLVAELEIEASSMRRLSDSIAILTTQSDELTITVEVLQEENQFLQDQIRALLRQDNENECALKLSVSSLQQKIIVQETEFNELNLKQATLETEYLKLQKKGKH